MAIRGNLSEASLADVLQLLALGQKTGCLSIAREGSFGTVHFVEGRVVHAALVNGRDRLGDRLVRLGALAADELARLATQLPAHDDHALANALRQGGVVDPDLVLAEFRFQVEEAVYHLFTWTQGTFTFEPDDDPAPDTPLLSISADTLLLEGARRVDEWSQIEKKLPSLDLIFEVDVARLQGIEVPLSTSQERIIPLLDGTLDVHAIVERSGLSEFDVGKALYGLISAGYVQRVGRSATRRQPPPESRVAEHRNLGIAFYRTGMLAEAEREFLRVLELREADGVARFHLGLVQARRGAWAEAEATFAQAAAAADAPPSVLHNLAFAQAQRGDTAAAAATLEAAHQAAVRGGVTPDPRMALLQATLALEAGQLAAAEEALATAHAQFGARQPSAAWYHAAALAAAVGGDTQRASALLEEGLQCHPQAVVLHNNLATVQERRGQYEGASRTLEHALLTDASLPQLHKNLGDYLYRAQRYDEAFDALSRVIRLAPSHGPDVYLKLGNIHYRRGDLVAARVAWESALQFDPEHRIVRANLAALTPPTDPVTVSTTTDGATPEGVVPSVP